MELDDARLIFAHRLRQARLDAGLTQEALGVAAGVAIDVARTRINRYEKGVNECDLRTAKRIADSLGIPLAAFYAETEEMADAITALARLSAKERREVLIDLKARAEAS